MDAPKKVLVIQIRQMGDVLLATPVIRAINQSYKGVKVDFLVNKPFDQILKNNPYINKVLINQKDKPLSNILKIRAERYDWVVDLLGNPRSALITFLSGAKIKAGFKHNWRALLYNYRVVPHSGQKYAADFKCDLVKGLGVTQKGSHPEIFNAGDEVQKITLYFNGINSPDSDLRVCFAPASRRPARRWLAGHYAKLGELLMEKYGAKIFIAWGPGEEGQVEEIVKASKQKFYVIPKFSLSELSAFIQNCDITVANSNGPMHIAEALKKPVLCIYGPNNPVNWSLPEHWSKYLRDESLDCIGCGAQVCPKNMECMRNISPEQAFDFLEMRFKNILDSKKPK